MKEIETIDDIKVLVNSFYSRIREDKLLGDIFNDVIKDQWPIHLDKMYRFWQTVLLSEHTYSGSPFPPHIKLPIQKEHFERWIELFLKTVEEHFSGSKAEEAKWRAAKMAEMFLLKINFYQNNSTGSLL